MAGGQISPITSFFVPLCLIPRCCLTFSLYATKVSTGYNDYVSQSNVLFLLFFDSALCIVFPIRLLLAWLSITTGSFGYVLAPCISEMARGAKAISEISDAVSIMLRLTASPTLKSS